MPRAYHELTTRMLPPVRRAHPQSLQKTACRNGLLTAIAGYSNRAGGWALLPGWRRISPWRDSVNLLKQVVPCSCY